MRQNVKNSAKKHLKAQRRKKIWKRIVTILSSIVVFCTTYALILPAITASSKAYCGIEEHVHKDSCYSKQVVCDKSENIEGHSHVEECYVLEKVLVCEKAESEGHLHVNSCVKVEKTLICNTEESEEHTHGENCYKEKNSYVCGKEESTGHTHIDACWEEKQKNVCGKNNDKTSEHRHAESCYKKELKCKLEEHTHEKACFSNPEADIETRAEWEKTLPDTLSGNWRKDVLTIADSQLGYRESKKNYVVDEKGEKKGYTRYGDWYGDDCGHWCAMFVSFCMDYAGVEGIPLEANCQQWINKLKQEPYQLYREPSEYTPQAGDIIFFDWDLDGESHHVGLVYSVELNDDGSVDKIRTIEGNSSNCVKYNTYNSKYKKIMGYGELVQKDLPKDTNELIYEDDEMQVTVQISDDFSMPKDAQLKVKKVEAEKEQMTFEAIEKAVKETVVTEEDQILQKLDVYDMSVLAEGEEIEVPDNVATVTTVEYKKALLSETELETVSELTVVTLEDEQSEYTVSQPKATIDNPDDGVMMLSFESQGVQTFAVAAEANTVTGDFWKRVESLDKLINGDTVIIVSPEGGVALTYGDSTKAIPVDLLQIDNNKKYYTITENNKSDSLAESGKYLASKFVVGSKNNNKLTLQNQSASSQYLRLENASTVFGNSRELTLTYRSTENVWTINSGNYYLWYNRDETLTASNSTSLGNTKTRRDMLIFKLEKVTLKMPSNQVEAQNPPSIPTKPIYESQSIQDEKVGTEEAINGLKGVNVGFAFDQPTSDLEERFTGIEADDGKVLTDKSVIYEDDDYDAFANYENGNFGVTLSALGQVMTEEGKIEPLMDVVIILDTSYSMINNSDSYLDEKGNVRMVWAMKALNEVIDQIMKVDENRVGLVTFSDTSQVVLPLDHYTTKDGQYLDLVKDDSKDDEKANPNHGRKKNFYDLNINSNVKDPAGDHPAFDFRYGPGEPNWEGTYTQSGIQEAAEILLNNPNTKDTNDNARQPVIILISDGGPTLCSSNYKEPLAGPIYGNSGQTVEGDHDADHDSYTYDGRGANRYGINGYYTVLTAQYYKDMVGSHYGLKTKFATVGIGIDGAQNSSTDKRLHDNRYCRAVLNPISSNLNDALNTFDNWKNEGTQFVNLLANAVDSQYISIPNHTNGFTTIGSTYSAVPVYKNPYSDFTYADKYYNGKNTTLATDLISYLNEIQFQEHGWKKIIEPGTDIEMMDPIGEGMEVKGDPILRFGATNYNHTSKATEGNVTTYKYDYRVKYSVAYPDNASSDNKDVNQELDLSTIDVIITTEEVDGKVLQTVKFLVPEELLPLLYPELYGSFYYEESPVRLIYQVGLTQQSIEECNNMEVGVEKVFYTNRWQGTTTTANINPTSSNPYSFNINPVEKEGESVANPTQTISTSFKSSVDANKNVVQELGNNGRLVLSKGATEVKVKKVWNGEQTESITVHLLANREIVEGKTITLPDDGKWEYTWTNLPEKNEEGEKITYTVIEEYLPGYTTTIEKGQSNITRTVVTWTAVKSFEKNQKYVLVSNSREGSDALGATASDKTTFSWIPVAVKSETLPDARAIWTADSTGATAELTNSSNKKRMNVDDPLRDSCHWDIESGEYSEITYVNSSGKIYYDGRFDDYYFKDINTNGTGSISDSSNAHSFTLYKLTEQQITENVDGDYWIITNTKVEEEPIELTIRKENGTGTALQGAVFDLYQGNASGEIIPGTESTKGILFMHNIAVQEDGSVKIQIPDKNATYYLVETVAPEGFEILETPIKFEVVNKEIKMDPTEMAKVTRNTLTVINKGAYALPETGGMGTTFFYLIGGTLVVLSGIVLATKKRMSVR